MKKIFLVCLLFMAYNFSINAQAVLNNAQEVLNVERSHKNKFITNFGYSNSYYMNTGDWVVEYVQINPSGLIFTDTISGTDPRANGMHVGLEYQRELKNWLNVYGAFTISYLFPEKRTPIPLANFNSYDAEASFYVEGGLQFQLVDKNKHGLLTAVGVAYGQSFSSSSSLPITDIVIYTATDTIVRLQRGWQADDNKTNFVGFSGKLSYKVPLKTDYNSLAFYYKVVLSPTDRLIDPLFINHQAGVSFGFDFGRQRNNDN